MAYNGAGTFVRVYDWTADADAAINIRADRMDEEHDGFATGLSTAITKDGQTTPTANIPLGGFRLTGVGNATTAGDAVNYNGPLGKPSSGNLANCIGGVLNGYIYGLTLSNSSGSPNTVVDFAAGVCADSENAVMLSLTAGSINFATTGANGLDTGSLANNTWYHCFAIGKTDGTTAFFASTSLSPTLPTGYTLKRRLGSVKTNGSAQLIAFTQNGDNFLWSSPIIDVAGIAPPDTNAALKTLTVPTGVKVDAVCTVEIDRVSADSAGYFSSPDQTDISAGSVVGFLAVTGTTSITGDIVRRTNTSAQIRARFSNTGCIYYVQTNGWNDRRGRDG